MKKWIFGLLIILCFSRFGCADHDDPNSGCMAGPCPFTATVRDLNGLDGCNFVLELDNGARLVPQKLIYIQAPDKNQDPGYYFNFIDGQKVCFDYRETEGVDACMAGKLVFLTCIEICDPGQE